MDNTKTFWTAHKEFYETEVRGPCWISWPSWPRNSARAASSAPIGIRGSASTSRRTRPTSPPTSTWAYLSLSADALGVGSGLYMPSPGQLARFRAAVADGRRGAELVGLVSGTAEKGHRGDRPRVLKSAPRGYPKDHPRIELLRHKGLTAWKEWPAGPGWPPRRPSAGSSRSSGRPFRSGVAGGQRRPSRLKSLGPVGQPTSRPPPRRTRTRRCPPRHAEPVDTNLHPASA